MTKLEWKVKCCKYSEPGIGTHKGKVYCSAHLREAIKKDKKEKK